MVHSTDEERDRQPERATDRDRQIQRDREKSERSRRRIDAEKQYERQTPDRGRQRDGSADMKRVIEKKKLTKSKNVR